MILSSTDSSWSLLGSTGFFALLVVPVQDDQHEWLTMLGFLGTAITLPVVVKSCAFRIHRRFEATFNTLAAAAGVGAQFTGAVATTIGALVVVVLVLLFYAFVALGVFGLLLIGIRAL